MAVTWWVRGADYEVVGVEIGADEVGRDVARCGWQRPLGMGYLLDLLDDVEESAAIGYHCSLLMMVASKTAWLIRRHGHHWSVGRRAMLAPAFERTTVDIPPSATKPQEVVRAHGPDKKAMTVPFILQAPNLVERRLPSVAHVCLDLA